MNWKNAATALKKVAPAAASAIAGPAGGLAATVIAGALGVDRTSQAIIEAVKSDPQAALKLGEISADLEKAAMLDVQDARRANGTHWFVVLLTSILLALFAATTAALILAEIPPANRDIITLLVGQLSGFASAGVSYWLGTSIGSSRRAATLDAIAKK